MDHPYYTVTVTNETQGWTYTTTEGDEWDPADDAVLISPLVYRWAFDGELIPGHMQPTIATVNLAARTADTAPVVDTGDLVTLDVRIGTAGARIIQPPPMRVTSAATRLVRGAYKALLSIELSDLSVDWRARVAYGFTRNDGMKWARLRFRERLAEIGQLFGYTIGCPTSWANIEPPAPPAGVAPLALHIAGTGGGAGDEINWPWPGVFWEALSKLLNSVCPGDLHHTAVTIRNGSHPSGYEYVGDVGAWEHTPALTDPDTDVRIELVPVSRRVPSSAGLPLQLAVSGGILHLTPRTPAGGNTVAVLGLDADWCEIPATARRARDGAVNWVNLKGYSPGTASYPQFTFAAANLSDVAARGLSARDVDTDMQHGPVDANGVVSVFEYNSVAVGNLYLSDTSALEARRSYDAFTLRSSLMDPTFATTILPLIAPRTPGETDGDGRLVRHVTLFDLDHDLRFEGEPVTGFVTGGTMTISGGDIVWTLDTVPGLPIYTGGTPTPVTFSELETFAAANGITNDEIDPLITLADLAYVDS